LSEERPKRTFRYAPVKVGEEYEIDITEKSYRGDAGVGRIEGFVIIVPETKPGDHVKVKITRTGRNYALAEISKS
jgi:predicted RNA-binding protein with TRAM domain